MMEDEAGAELAESSMPLGGALRHEKQCVLSNYFFAPRPGNGRDFLGISYPRCSLTWSAVGSLIR